MAESYERRRADAARDARAAAARGDDAASGEAWRRFRLISDGMRDPDALIAEGVALSRTMMHLAADSRPA